LQNADSEATCCVVNCCSLLCVLWMRHCTLPCYCYWAHV
jgi:hypothetical protein